MTSMAVLLVAGALTAPPNAAPPAPPADVNGVSASADITDQDVRRRTPQRRGEAEENGQWGERPHRIGVGGSIVVSNYGASGGFRYWFGDRVGVNLSAGWHNNGGRSSATSASSVVVLPSMVVMLTKPKDTGQIDVRPYAGGGVNYARMSGAVPAGQRQSGAGYQVFGGAEITLRDMDAVTFSGEGIYYAVPSNYLNAPMSSGFTYGFAVHFYLK